MHKRRPHWLPEEQAPMDPEEGGGNKDEFDPDPVMAKEPMLFQVSAVWECIRSGQPIQ